jgi:hypothetical protein
MHFRGYGSSSGWPVILFICFSLVRETPIQKIGVKVFKVSVLILVYLSTFLSLQKVSKCLCYTLRKSVFFTIYFTVVAFFVSLLKASRKKWRSCYRCTTQGSVNDGSIHSVSESWCCTSLWVCYVNIDVSTSFSVICAEFQAKCL